MVRHQPLQYYEPQLCLSCLTGIYGCRWKRYQRSHDDTTPVSYPGMESEGPFGPQQTHRPARLYWVALDGLMAFLDFNLFLFKTELCYFLNLLG